MIQTYSRKFFFWLVITMMVVGQLVQFIPETAKADSTDYVPENSAFDASNPEYANSDTQVYDDNTIPIPDADNETGIYHNAPTAAVEGLQQVLDAHNASATGAITFDDLFGTDTSGSGAKIIVSNKDRKAIRATQCLSQILPDYANDPAALYNDLPTSDQATITAAVDAEKSKTTALYKTPADYLFYLDEGVSSESFDDKQANLAKYGDYLRSAKSNKFNDEQMKKIWEAESNNILNGGDTSVDVSTLSCVTGLDADEIDGMLQTDDGRSDLSDLIYNAITKNTIDIRVLKTLVYLVTPKSEGGAGHWRVKVRRILQSDPKSNESDSAIETLSSAENQTTGCADDMTAADCGRSQTEAQTSTTSSADAIVQDQDNKEYEAWLQDLEKTEDTTLANRNYSAHFSGQAVDISELDDIRCTLVVTTSGIGGSTTRTKQPAKPTKLAWQTTDGWNKSGGANEINDMLGLVRQTASANVSNLLSTLSDGNTSIDQSNLTNNNLDDMIGTLGQSLVSQVLGSPTSNLDGTNVRSTLTNLGGDYFADYLGIPTDTFSGQNVQSLDDINYLIGRRITEAKLGLPTGALDDELVNSDGTVTHSLDGVLENTGRAKVESEMGLQSGDLLNANKYGSFTDTVGVKVIEDELNLPKDSWSISPKNFTQLEQGDLQTRLNLFMTDPDSIDSTLHLPSGTTSSFVNGSLDSTSYAIQVGTKRLENTSAGLKYFDMNNSGYNLPNGVWEQAISGNTTAYKTIGQYEISKTLTGNGNFIDVPDANIPANTASYELYPDGVSTSDTSSSFEPSKFGQELIKDWLSNNTSSSYDSGCNQSDPLLSSLDTINPSVSPSGFMIDAERNNLCPLKSGGVNYRVKYTLKDGTTGVSPSYTGSLRVPTSGLTNLGLSSLDLQLIFGYKDVANRSVFETIGSKVLYHGMADKVLDAESKQRVALSEELIGANSNSSSSDFYLSRSDRLGTLANQLQTDWNVIKGDTLPVNIDTETAAILTATTNPYSSSDSALTKIKKIMNLTRNIANDASAANEKLETIRQYYLLKFGQGDSHLGTVNLISTDLSEISRTISEISSGKAIPTADVLTQSNVTAGATVAAGTNGQQTESTLTSSSTFGQMLFSLVSGQNTPENLFLTFGAQSAEGKLNLPPNSLLYLVNNYEDYGLTGQDSLLAAIGQAKIENQFSLPYGYFQGQKSIDELNFSDPKTLKQWLPTSNPKYSWLASYSDDQMTSFVNDNLSHPENGNYDLIAQMQTDAKDNYYADYFENNGLDQKSGINSLQNVYDNVKSNNLTDGIRSPEADLMLRMGLSVSSTSDLASNTSALKLATQDDYNLGLKSGTIAAFLTGKTISSAEISNDDAHAIEASDLKIDSGILEKFVMMLNGKLPIALTKTNETDPLKLLPEYIYANPYAQPVGGTNHDCKSPFQPDSSGFAVNNGEIVNNSYCIYDLNGRHCFKSREEALRYSDAHASVAISGKQVDGKTVDDVLGVIAMRLADTYNSTSPAAALSFDDLYRGLIDFAKDNTKTSIFNTASLSAIAASYSGVADDNHREATLANKALSRIAAKTHNTSDSLSGVFMRETGGANLYSFAKMVGEKETRSTVNTHIFDDLNIDMSTTAFDGGDLYKVLTGDTSSLDQIATGFLDNTMNLQSGDSQELLSASGDASTSCALDNSAGTLLAGLTGMNSISTDSFNSTFPTTLGQDKIEQTLGLPEDSFKSGSLQTVASKIGYLDFTSLFDVPVLNSIPDDLMKKILGIKADRYLSDPTETKINVLQSFLAGSSYLPSSVMSAAKELNTYLSGNLNTVLGSMGGGVSGLNNLAPTTGLADWDYSVQSFGDLLSSADTMLGLNSSNLLNVFQNPGNISNLISQVSDHALSSLTSTWTSIDTGTPGKSGNIGMLFGISDDNALKLLEPLQNIFVCSKPSISLPFLGRSGGCDDPQYKNWGDLGSQLPNLVNLQLDTLAGTTAGTFSQVISNPTDPFASLLSSGTRMLDNMLFPMPAADGQPDRSDTIASFTQMFKVVDSSLRSSAESAAHNNSSQVGQIQSQIESALGSGNHSLFAQLSNSLTSISSKEISDMLGARNEQISSQREPGCSGLGGIVGRRCPSDSPDLWSNGISTAISDIFGYVRDEHVSVPLLSGGSGGGVGIASTGLGRLFRQDISYSPLTDATSSNLFQHDLHALFSGQVDFIGSITQAMSVNSTMIDMSDPRHTSCDYESTQNNPSQCQINVPGDMMTSYSTIHGSLFGNPIANMAANIASTFNFATNNGLIGPTNPDTVSTFDQFTNQISNFYGSNQVTDAINRINDQFSFPTGTNFDPSSYVQNLTSQFNTNLASLTNPLTSLTDQLNISNNLQQLGSLMTNLPFTQDNAISSTINNFSQMLNFKSIDSSLWSLDKNIPIGFAESLFTGNVQERLFGIGDYLSNSFDSHSLLGLDFSSANLTSGNIVNQFEQLTGTSLPLADLQSNFAGLNSFIGSHDLSAFVSSGSFSFVNDLFSSHFDSVLGFKLPTDITGGLVGGLFGGTGGLGSGNWGFPAGCSGVSCFTGAASNVFNFAGPGGSPFSFPTLGSSISSWMNGGLANLGSGVGSIFSDPAGALNLGFQNIFNWGDTALGLPFGQSFGLFDSANGLFSNFKSLTNFQNLLPGMPGLSGIMDFSKILPDQFGQLLNLQDTFGSLGLQSAFSGINGMLASSFNNIIPDMGGLMGMLPGNLMGMFSGNFSGMLMNNLLGSSLGQLGSMLPGGLGTLTSLLSGDISGLIQGQLTSMLSSALALGPIGAYMQLANMLGLGGLVSGLTGGLLGGSTTIELFCTGDGYYPQLEKPDPINKDVGTGVWGGDVQDPNFQQIMQEHFISTAQYKARRLIGDVLQTQNSSQYNDPDQEVTVPHQILTGRREDVEYWKNSITVNMCQIVLGSSAQAYYEDGKAVCGGNTRVGVWYDPSSVAWTHIGF
ncbi:MAG: hypothetical protein NTW50_01530 [Candidatus Berkelbacteria bacterium]|nr:hypothetical protein [Candidatus Berkelbacteria bacterium]